MDSSDGAAEHKADEVSVQVVATKEKNAGAVQAGLWTAPRPNWQA